MQGGVVVDLGQLTRCVIAVRQILPSAIGLADQLPRSVVAELVAGAADIGVAGQLAKGVVAPGRQPAVGVLRADLFALRVEGGGVGGAVRIRHADHVAAQVVGVPRDRTRAVGLRELVPGLVIRRRGDQLGGGARYGIVRADRVHGYRRRRDRCLAAQVVVAVLGDVAQRVGQQHFVAKRVVIVHHHAAVGVEFLHEVAAAIPHLGVDVTVGVHHGHLPAQPVVVDLRDRAVGFPATPFVRFDAPPTECPRQHGPAFRQGHAGRGRSDVPGPPLVPVRGHDGCGCRRHRHGRGARARRTARHHRPACPIPSRRSLIPSDASNP